MPGSGASPSPPSPPPPALPWHCSDLGCELPCTAPFTGQLTSGLQLLPDLQILDLSMNALSGPLPVAWGNPDSFPSVVQFDISHNQFTGNMPNSWSIGPAFVNIVTLDVRTICGAGTCGKKTPPLPSPLFHQLVPADFQQPSERSLPSAVCHH